MELRTCRPDELRAVLAVWSAADAEPTITDDEDALYTLLSCAPASILVALEGQEIVGTLIVGWDGWRGAFYRLAVLPSFRRQGVARRLVGEGERRLAALGARRIALFAVTADPGAAAFWIAVGYRPQQDRLRLVKNAPTTNAVRTDAD
ncbi:MAG: GNAT family N-acetyltransferase [Acidimicrobiales bacterium]